MVIDSEIVLALVEKYLEEYNPKFENYKNVFE